MEQGFEKKYKRLFSNCQQVRWRLRCFPVEVGCRDFTAHSLARAFSNFGIQEREVEKSHEAAEKASRWLWLKRGGPWSHKELAIRI